VSGIKLVENSKLKDCNCSNWGSADFTGIGPHYILHLYSDKIKGTPPPFLNVTSNHICVSFFPFV